MTEIYQNLYIGDELSCSWDMSGKKAIIHACKHPCHCKAVGYSGNLNSSHPNYLIWENKNHLVLNLVDMKREFHPKYTHPIIEASINFLEKNISEREVIIHCNQGQSRSPSIGLIYLARLGVIEKESYQIASKRFLEIYPSYLPGLGISKYLTNHWQEILKI